MRKTRRNKKKTRRLGWEYEGMDTAKVIKTNLKKILELHWHEAEGENEGIPNEGRLLYSVFFFCDTFAKHILPILDK